MTDFDLLLTGGRVVLESGERRADVAIAGGIIAAVLLTAAVPGTGRAHDPGLSAMTLDVQPGRLAVHLVVARREIEPLVAIDADGNGAVSARELARARPHLQSLATSTVTLDAGPPAIVAGSGKTVGALDPCGHLVCKACWDGANFAGCPICHRRVSLTEPFVEKSTNASGVVGHSGQLTLVHLGMDAMSIAKQRFERLLARQTPLSPDDRDEIETVIDTIGPKVAAWLPPRRQ